jgi:hypothetical protein
VDFALSDDAEVTRSAGEAAHIGSWRRRFGRGESGVKLVRAGEWALAMCRCCVRLENLLFLERLLDTCAYGGGASSTASSIGEAPATASSVEGTASDATSSVGRQAPDLASWIKLRIDQSAC